MSACPPLVWCAEPDTPDRLLRLVTECDQAGFDAVVLPGGPADTVDAVLVAGWASRPAPRIGLVAALSPWSQPPFLTARALNTLDALTGGRAGWFIDTAAPVGRSTDDSGRWTPAGASDDELAAACADYLAATDALWSSWEPGAIVADVASGRYVDAAKVHVPDHRGPFYATRGPLNAPPGPQGRPVLVAGWQPGRPAAIKADVLVVDVEADVAAAHAHAPVVLLAVGAVHRLTATAADGFAVVGVPYGAASAALVHGPLAAWADAPRAGLLRDRLGLPDPGDRSPADALTAAGGAR